MPPISKMKTVTYSLLNGDANSGHYYADVAALAEAILRRANERLCPIVDTYLTYLRVNKSEKLRTREEYFFDLLTAGTIWRVYAPEASRLAYPEYFLLSRLYELRKKNKQLKLFIDLLRGIIGTLSLRRKRKNEAGPVDFSFKNFIKLLRWMEASGEFQEEVKRLNLLKRFLGSRSNHKADFYLKAMVEFSEWFESEAVKTLGKFTPNVDYYLNGDFREHLWKEDVIFCGRKEVEYYLSMVGAEIMNRAVKEDFDASERKAVLVPACMRLRPEETCEAKKVSLDYLCSGCSPNCGVNRLTILGRRTGFEVHMIPHSSDSTAWLNNWAAGKDIGVVGVACPLNLTAGGLQLKSLDIPAQCVLLDYCGCKNHWDKKGFPTDINREQLEIMMEDSKVERSVAAAGI